MKREEEPGDRTSLICPHRHRPYRHQGRADRSSEREIVLQGPLDEAQRTRLLEIADRCPVHRTLTSQIEISTRLL